MPASVQQDVAQRDAHLFRRRQETMMVALGEHAAAPSGDPIDRPGEPRPDRLHAAPERSCDPAPRRSDERDSCKKLLRQAKPDRSLPALGICSISAPRGHLRATGHPDRI
jgi:hypothetical protein